MTDAEDSGSEDTDRWQFVAWMPIFVRHPIQDRWLPLDQLLHRRPLQWVVPRRIAAWVREHRDAVEDRQLERGTHSLLLPTSAQERRKRP